MDIVIATMCLCTLFVKFVCWRPFALTGSFYQPRRHECSVGKSHRVQVVLFK